MHVWFFELGEPLPFVPGQRLLRYGELTRLLAAKGHRVTWWAADFLHQTRTHVGAPDSRVNSDGVEIVLAHGPGYRRNVGLARLRHVAAHARSVKRLIADEPPPDVIVCAMPTIETCAVVREYAQRHGVPWIVDVRDEWPEDYVRWLPAPLRPLGRLALTSKFRALEHVCAAATAIAAVSERQLEYGLSFAGRPRGPLDMVFHTGARAEPCDPAALKKYVAEWRERGLSKDSFNCVFSGTMSPSRPLTPLID